MEVFFPFPVFIRRQSNENSSYPLPGHVLSPKGLCINNTINPLFRPKNGYLAGSLITLLK
jgi:hypothetical protein